MKTILKFSIVLVHFRKNSQLFWCSFCAKREKVRASYFKNITPNSFSSRSVATMSSNIATTLSESSTGLTTSQDTLRHIATRHQFQVPSTIVAASAPLSTVFASTNYNTAMTIVGNGSVGIGTTAPLAKLDVNGSANINGTIITSTNVELGQSRLTDGSSYVDFHSSAGTDYDARFIKNSGVSGILSMTNVGDISINAGTTFATAGTERVRVTTAGSVGIGTISPLAALHVNAGARVSGDLTVGPASSTFGTSTAYSANRFASVNAGSGAQNSDGTVYTAAQGIKLVGEDLTWGANTSYASSIEVDGGRSALAQLNHGQIRFNTANAQRMVVNESGSVGIGKTNPACSLDVSGSVNVSSLYFNNSSFGITYSTFTITSANTWYTIFTSTGPGVYLISCCDLQFAWGGCLSVTCDSAGNGGIVSFTVLSSNYMLFQKSTNELQIKSGSANRTLNISFYRLA